MQIVGLSRTAAQLVPKAATQQPSAECSHIAAHPRLKGRVDRAMNLALRCVITDCGEIVSPLRVKGRRRTEADTDPGTDSVS